MHHYEPWSANINPIYASQKFMMTSANGNIFRVTGHLCGEFTGHRWITAQRAVTRSFGVLFDLNLNKRLSKQSWGWWFETPSITSLTFVTVHPGADQRKHQSSASLAFVRGIHRWPVNFPHKWLVTRKMFPFDGVIMANGCGEPGMQRDGTGCWKYCNLIGWMSI